MNQHNDVTTGPDRDDQGFFAMLIDTYRQRVPAGRWTAAFLVLAGIVLLLAAIFGLPYLLG
jgi:hypothetical protein